MSHTARNRLVTARPNKLVSLNEAIATICDGDVLCLGSFIDNRRPMAAAYEIVRQQKRGLILLAHVHWPRIFLVEAGVQWPAGLLYGNGYFRSLSRPPCGKSRMKSSGPMRSVTSISSWVLWLPWWESVCGYPGYSGQRCFK